MEIESHTKLVSIISGYPHLYQFLDDIIKKQCEKNLSCYILKGLIGQVEGRKDEEFKQHLSTLERRLNDLAPSKGYDRLKKLIQSASDWEKYQDFLSQIDITIWFREKGVLKEIEPELPRDFRTGYGDALISSPYGELFCEVHSSSSLVDVKSPIGISHERQKVKKAVRILLEKTNHQLPRNKAGILCLDATKSASIWSHDVKEIAEKLFPNRQQLAVIMLWSWEGNGEPSWDMVPNSFFVNSYSKFRDVGEGLLKYLNIKCDIMVI